MVSCKGHVRHPVLNALARRIAVIAFDTAVATRLDVPPQVFNAGPHVDDVPFAVESSAALTLTEHLQRNHDATLARATTEQVYNTLPLVPVLQGKFENDMQQFLTLAPREMLILGTASDGD